MISRTALFIPIALGLMTTACSTTSNTSSQGQSGRTEGGNIPHSSVARNPASFQETLQEKNQRIAALQQTLTKNQSQLADLQHQLDEKDALIDALGKSSSSSEALIALEKEKRLRRDLESRYAQLRIDNDRLNKKITQLKTENISLEKQLTSNSSVNKTSQNQASSNAKLDFVTLNKSYQTLNSAYSALQKKYHSLENKEKTLQQRYNKLTLDNLSNQKALDSLKAENLKLGGQISDARAQQESLWDKIHVQEGMIKHLQAKLTEQYRNQPTPSDDTTSNQGNSQLQGQIATLEARLKAQVSLIDDYKKKVRTLKKQLAQHKVNNRHIKALETQLARLEQMNVDANKALKDSNKALLASQAQAESLSNQLTGLEQDKASLEKQLASLKEQSARDATERNKLAAQVNDLIPFQAEVASLKNQLAVGLQSVTWQLPKEASLHNNFEIVVTARVNNPVAGQSYIAQLVTDSAIQMISSPKVEATLQNGQLQWRWRLNGLNERPNAKLNLFVSQQMNYHDKVILRQVYDGSETMALNNDNLLDKYGFWAGAILLGLAGGFGAGYMSRRKKEA
ncbi:Chromosome partition protein Smc [Marinomonas spartinae]|uniref:Chromosome partition protein Smc n=1 Tax=Marinomonas spartinae TaxID=1792290 RepID=A0A1A8TKW7_9GAMM|nr:hypothetical protein [Marinomonas spartinae]SBS34487.1 Chromosome partition protein Smc [Marinomonas spartinae]